MGSDLVFALTLGLTGSLGHCFGMCGGISLMLGAAGGGERRLQAAAVWANLGRVTTYAVLGGVMGVVGGTLVNTIPGLTGIQGALALLAAGFAIYTSLALLGRAPSPDLLLKNLTGRWGKAMQGTLSRAARRPYLTGLLWGFLPCGLVLVALAVAIARATMPAGALVMAVFGVGTLPAMLGIGAAGHLVGGTARGNNASTWVSAAAGVVAVFGIQMALRGLAAWGLVDHVSVGDVVLW